ncbi:MAG: DNA repair protein RecN [Lachnospiraceae bacterium]|nr:DNA repair protein RecN [Lachnospiraceae bacterium]
MKNLALVEETEVFFTEGLNILTGETGAGKSIIIGSINLALGAKAEKDIIRSGAEFALIELTFLADNPEIIESLEKMELSIAEDGLIVLQRKIMPGRSILRINGETITAAQLKNIAGKLLDLHGQHEHQTLLKAANHREILDSFGQDSLFPLKNELKEIYNEYRTLSVKLEEEGLDENERKREIDLLEFEVREIENASLIIGEDEKIEKEYQKMNNAGKIREAVAFAHGITGYDRTESAGLLIGRALKEIMAVSVVDDDLAALSEQLNDIDGLLNDFNRSAADYLTSLEFDDVKFNETETRLDQLNYLKKKYQNTVEGIINLKEEKKKRLEVLADYENYRVLMLEKQLALKENIIVKCQKISAIRKKLKHFLEENLIKALIDLNFPDVRFEVAITSEEENFTVDGFDKIVFMIAPNPGEEIKALNQIASGGELSRIMLALKTIKAGIDDKKTLIFDEIDTGISGKTAWKVAERLGILAKGHQVICITHLSQIAAMADAHFAIRKEVVNARTLTQIEKLNEKESINELGRLLGTESLTDAVIKNALEMKELAYKFKNN